MERNAMNYLMVGDNGVYTTDWQTEEQIISGLSRNGGTVQVKESRRTDDYKLIYIDGRVVGKAFSDRSTQKRYLVESGIL